MKADRIQRGGHYPFLVNMGILPHFDFGPAVRYGYLTVGIMREPPGVVVSTSTFNGCMTFSLGYCSEAIHPEIAERLIDDFIGLLPK